MDNDPKWLRESARLLGSLLQTPDEELDELRRERLDGREHPNREELADARRILCLLSESLHESNDARWQAVRQARQVLEDWHGMKAPVLPAPVLPAPTSAPVVAQRAPSAPPRPAAPAGPSPWAPAAPIARMALPVNPLSAPTMATSGAPRGEPLPFSGQRAAPPARSALEPHAAFGQTAPAKPPKGEALPFQTAPALALEQYACFRAENAMWPDRRGDILARYGLDEGRAQATERHYDALLGGDAAQKARYDQLLDHYRRQLQG